MNQTVINALVPVVLLIAVGFAAGRFRLMDDAGIKGLSNLVFVVLTPALLFRSMSTVHVEQINLRPVLAYFLATGVLFFATLAFKGMNRRAAVLALGTTFSNTVMIGIPIVGLAFGADGTVIILMLVSFHSLVILGTATVVFEVAMAREQAANGMGEQRHMAATIATAVRNSIIHPVPIPIFAGLAFAQTGWVIPEVIDQPMRLMGQAFGPIALLMVGVQLAFTPVNTHAKGALAVAAAKNMLHPLLVAAACWAMGVHGLPMQVMIMTAGLPLGANVFMFAQRYNVAEELITASTAISALLALFTLSLILTWIGV